MRLLFTFLLFLTLRIPATEMLVTLCENAYSGNFDRVWVSVNVSKPSVLEQRDARSSGRVMLRNSDTGEETGLWLEIRAPEPGKEMVSLRTDEQVQETLFANIKAPWFEASVLPLRETFSIKQDSGTWHIVIGGAGIGEEISVEWIFARDGENKREVTLTGPDGKIILKESIDNRGGHHVKGRPWRGGEDIHFRITPTGRSWTCLPNAIRIVRSETSE